MLHAHLTLEVHTYHKSSLLTDHRETTHYYSFNPNLLNLGRGLQGCLTLSDWWALRIRNTYGLYGWNRDAALAPKSLRKPIFEKIVVQRP